MNFKTKTILLVVALSLVPYILSVSILGTAYRRDFEERLKLSMQHQVEISAGRLDQRLRTLKNDLQFMASLDIMNDILSEDLDRRIFHLLENKKKDLQLDGNFDVIDIKGNIVASSEIGRLGKAGEDSYFLRYPVHSSFNDKQIGTLGVIYEESNLTRLFKNEPHFEYHLVKPNEEADKGIRKEDLQAGKVLEERSGWKVILIQDREYALATLGKVSRSLIIGFLIGAFIIGLIAYLSSRILIRPILQLSATAHRITKTEDFSQRVNVQSSDEVGQLSVAFNSMLAGIEQMIERLKEESENRIKLAEEKNRSEMLQSLSTKLAKYLSPQVYNSIFSGQKEATLGSSRKKLTIFFSDIVDFTRASDQMESEDLTELLNRYLREMTDIALEHGATIDKYIGDAIMIFFGDPESRGPKEDATRCVNMALSMQTRVKELRAEWLREGFAQPFNIRVGIHSGFCTVGNFGTEERMDYTIVGSAVNLASRIESSAKPGTVYISEETQLLVRESFSCVPADKVTPKGFSQPISLYQVLPSEQPNRIHLHEKGLECTIDSERITHETIEKLQQELDGLRGKKG